MRDIALNKGKIAILVAGSFCLYAAYSAIVDLKLPKPAQATEPIKSIVELDPVDIQLLGKMHIFGQPPQKPDLFAGKDNTSITTKPAQPKSDSNGLTKPIKINITVTGLLASTDDNFVAAILQVDDIPERLYRIGEDLGKPEVRLARVEHESVIINNNGNEQTIAMKRKVLESESNIYNETVANPGTNQNTNLVPALPPMLELPEDLEVINAGAYTPPMPEQILENDPPLPDELEDDIFQQQFKQDSESALEYQNNPPSTNQPQEVPPLPELEGQSSSPDFQMPLF